MDPYFRFPVLAPSCTMEGSFFFTCNALPYLFMSLRGYSERLFTSRIVCFGTSLVIWFSFISLFNAS
jgi:hypothetical protein